MATLQQLYIQGLRVLGVTQPGNIQLQAIPSLTPVIVMSDVGDVAAPHSNPVFAIQRTQAPPGAANASMISILAIDRFLRVRQIRVGDQGLGTTSDVRIFSSGAQLITTITGGPSVGTSLGPNIVAGTATWLQGHTVGTAFVPGSYAPEQAVTIDYRPPLLIAPGNFLYFAEGTTLNIGMQIEVIWEELPRQDETTNLGFPTAAGP